MTEFRFTTVESSGSVVVPTPHDPKPHPGPNPVSAHYNYDGSVLLSDGRIVKADGTVVTPAPLPAGGVRNPDGSVTVDGKTFNPDGTERTAIVIPPQTIQLPVGGTTTVPGFTIRADGVAVDANNVPLTPQPRVIRNYDGTATVISGNQVDVWGRTARSARSSGRPAQHGQPGRLDHHARRQHPQPGRLHEADAGEAPEPRDRAAQRGRGEGRDDRPEGRRTRPAHRRPDQPAPATPTCPDVVADAAATCKLPTGSADSTDPKEDAEGLDEHRRHQFDLDLDLDRLRRAPTPRRPTPAPAARRTPRREVRRTDPRPPPTPGPTLWGGRSCVVGTAGVATGWSGRTKLGPGRFRVPTDPATLKGRRPAPWGPRTRSWDAIAHGPAPRSAGGSARHRHGHLAPAGTERPRARSAAVLAVGVLASGAVITAATTSWFQESALPESRAGEPAPAG